MKCSLFKNSISLVNDDDLDKKGVYMMYFSGFSELEYSYIGSTFNSFRKRWIQHIQGIKNLTNVDNILKGVSICGESNIRFKIIHLCQTKQDCLIIEKEEILKRNPSMNKGGGRKKNEDRPSHLQTSMLNVRLTNEARDILNTFPKSQRGKIVSEIITSNKYTISERNAYASEKVKDALKLAAERATIWVETPFNGTEFDDIRENIGCQTYPVMQITSVSKNRILSLETELLNQIQKDI